MKRMTVLLGIALVSLGCSNDEGETSPASDASSATEIGQASDTIAAQDTGPTDAGEAADVLVLDSALPDSALLDTAEADDTAADTATVDAGPVDAGSAGWPSDAVSGQCKTGSECPGSLCNAGAPGGLCQGCGECPSGYDCNFGTCNQWCDDTPDCPPGLKCNQSKGVCVSTTCSVDSDCFAPYVCSGGLCGRPECEDDGSCPAPFACSGNWCVEPGA